MTIMEMMGQSGVLTILGMGIVFSFLVIMVICVSVMGKIVHALGADKDVAAAAGSTAAGGTQPVINPAKSTAVTAAIAAAVAEYQKDNSI